jgi:hypothetical protein
VWHGRAEVVQASAGLGGAAQGMETVHVWIAGLAGLRGMAWQSGYPAGLRVQPGGDPECLWIASLVGYKGSVRWRSCGSEGWEFRVVWLWQAEEQG